MSNLDRKTKRLLRAEKFHKHWDPIWDSIPFGVKVFVVFFLLLVSLVVVSNIRFRYTQRYASPEKLTEVFRTYEAEFENAKDILIQLPLNSTNKTDEQFYKTILHRADNWDPSVANESESKMLIRKCQDFWISSFFPYSDEELKLISDAVSPLFHTLPLENIAVFPNQGKVFFIVYNDNRQFIGHADIILYDKTSEILKGQALQEYIEAFSQNRSPIDLALIKAGWIAYSQGDG